LKLLRLAIEPFFSCWGGGGGWAGRGGEGLELATTVAAAVAVTANRYSGTPSATARLHSGQSGTAMAYGTGRDNLFNNYTLTLSPLIEKVKYGTRIKYVFTMVLCIDLLRIAKKPALELSTNSENLWQDPDRKQKKALIAGHMPK
jgi:hypothetical protein